MSCPALLGESLLSIQRLKRIFSFREKERRQDKAWGRGKANPRQPKAEQGKPRQPKAEQGKPRARHTLPVSCLALLGESLLSIKRIKRTF